VLWVGIGEGAAELRELARRLAEGLAAAGLIFENRFEPHVTIGRVKRPLPENFFRRTADFSASKRASSAVASVELMESRLTQDGPVYGSVYSRKL
jgi:2'-5' RNA ligase